MLATKYAFIINAITKNMPSRDTNPKKSYPKIDTLCSRVVLIVLFAPDSNAFAIAAATSGLGN